MKKKTTASTAKLPPLPEPPPTQPPEVEELYAAHDFEELTYRRMAQMRSRKKRTPEQNAALAKHDALERRITEEPESVLQEAYKALDHGTTLLLKLIRSERLMDRSFKPDGSVYSDWDTAAECLKSRVDYLNRQLIRLAERGVPNIRVALFSQAKLLTEAFIRLAQAFPADFISCAETTLTMPSLRAKNPKFTADAEAIAKAIRLAEKHPDGMMTDDKERIGELCGSLVLKVLESINWARKSYRTEQEHLKWLQANRETAQTYKAIGIEEFLRRTLYSTRFDLVIACAALPELRDDPTTWWKQRVKPMLREEFERLKRNPSHNLALWTELGRSTNQGTDGARWKALSDNCRNKMNQLARRSKSVE